MTKSPLIIMLVFLAQLSFIATAAIADSVSFPPPVQDIGGPVLYSITPPADPLINRYIDEYLTESGKKTAASILARSDPYRNFIYNMLVEKNMPPELMYLPAVESGFRTHAVSSSGAAGLWQFMMNSISPYDITVNEWQDDRRDFWKATEAALHKLQYNYKQLGSWPLALAAYNCGLGRVTRAVQSSGIDDYMDLYENGFIPRETRLYVAKFFAFSHLAGYASRFGLEQTSDQSNDQLSVIWNRIPLDQAVDLRLLAAQSGVPLSMLIEANAELRYGITPPADAGYFLKVPEEFSDNIRRVLKNNEKPLVRFYLHEIKSGDTFYGLSRHFGVPVSMIESYNPSAGARSLRSGQKIIIPAVKETEPYRDTASSAQRWQQSRPYMVKPGDTLWSIAESSGTTAEELAFNNGLSAGGVLRAGITIQIPGENN